MADILIGPWARKTELEEHFLCGERATRFFPRHSSNVAQRQVGGTLFALLVARASLNELTRLDRFFPQISQSADGDDEILELAPAVQTAFAALGISVRDPSDCTVSTLRSRLDSAIRETGQRYYEAVTGLSGKEDALLVGYSKVYRIRGIWDASLFQGRITLRPWRQEALYSTGRFGKPNYECWATELSSRHKTWLLPASAFQTKKELVELYRASREQAHPLH